MIGLDAQVLLHHWSVASKGLGRQRGHRSGVKLLELPEFTSGVDDGVPDWSIGRPLRRSNANARAWKMHTAHRPASDVDGPCRMKRTRAVELRATHGGDCRATGCARRYRFSDHLRVDLRVRCDDLVAMQKVSFADEAASLCVRGSTTDYCL
ncbi:hypothetical protein KDW55_15965 [Burkholderia sp. AU19243]|nr:hypothetical protein [Burkholderia vietnamiensis]MBR8364814.1 hypothetical protein [Burkholderia sp. AU19243]